MLFLRIDYFVLWITHLTDSCNTSLKTFTILINNRILMHFWIHMQHSILVIRKRSLISSERSLQTTRQVTDSHWCCNLYFRFVKGRNAKCYVILFSSQSLRTFIWMQTFGYQGHFSEIYLSNCQNILQLFPLQMFCCDFIDVQHHSDNPE